MVTVIHASSSLSRALNYNHQKEVQGKATCILAANYPKDPEEMNFYQKLHRLTNQAALNQRTKVNSVHISINFDPSEKLDRTALAAITIAYMEKIGFGEQPFLVYEHRDAGHPHLHVVTTSIRANGKRIALHNLGKNQSEKARKSIEKEFDLVLADQKKQQKEEGLKAVAIRKVTYGKSETKRAITNVLDAVLNKYKFTSLEELNAVLREANVQASRGSQTSRTYQRGGLLYQVLDEHGKPIGVPIKASSIYSKPTLKTLKNKFRENAFERLLNDQQQEYEQRKWNEMVEIRRIEGKRITMPIDFYIRTAKNPSMEGLKEALGKEGIALVEYTAKDGQIYGVTYVNHVTGAVFKGSDLGKQYTAKGLEARLAEARVHQSIERAAPRQNPTKSTIPSQEYKPPFLGRSPSTVNRPSIPDPSSETIEQPIHSAGSLPYELRNNERKKRKKKRLRL